MLLANWSRSSQVGLLASFSDRPRHCRATAPGCLIKNGRRERLPYKILKTTAFAVAVIAARGSSTLNLFGWIHCGLPLRRFVAHAGELLLEFLQLVIR